MKNLMKKKSFRGKKNAEKGPIAKIKSTPRPMSLGRVTSKGDKEEPRRASLNRSDSHYIHLEKVIERKWIKVAENPEMKSSFRVITQNVMAQRYVNVGRHQYDWVPKVYVKFVVNIFNTVVRYPYRRRKMHQQIVHYDADIVCLQELSQRNFDYLEEKLSVLNYEGVYKQNTKIDSWIPEAENLVLSEREKKIKRAKDGLGIFWKKNVFECEKSYPIEFNTLAFNEMSELQTNLEARRKALQAKHEAREEYRNSFKQTDFLGTVDGEKAKFKFGSEWVSVNGKKILFCDVMCVKRIAKMKSEEEDISKAQISFDVEILYDETDGEMFTTESWEVSAREDLDDFQKILLWNLEIADEPETLDDERKWVESRDVTHQEKRKFFGRVCLKSHNCALSAVFKHKSTGKSVLVSTIHGDYQWTRPSAQTWQKEVYFKNVHEILNSSSHDISAALICGDFNVKPRGQVFDFIQNRSLDPDVKPAGMVYKILRRRPKHKLRLIESYPTNKKKYTHFLCETMKTSSIDYMYHVETKEVVPVRILELPKKSEISPFPSKFVYSDHLMLGTEYSFVKEKKKKKKK